MTDEKLNKASKLKEEIKELNNLINCAELGWSRLSFTERIKKRFIKFKGYGFGYPLTNGEEYQMSNELSKKILVTMKEHLSELEAEYEKV